MAIQPRYIATLNEIMISYGNRFPEWFRDHARNCANPQYAARFRRNARDPLEYRLHMGSDIWKLTRQALILFQDSCEDCGLMGKTLDVHHLTYEHFAVPDVAHLVDLRNGNRGAHRLIRSTLCVRSASQRRAVIYCAHAISSLY